MKRLSIGIAGAGLLGRLLAWRLSRLGHGVRVFDPAAGPAPAFDGHQAAGFTAAGMLSPLAERDTGSATVAALGWRSIALWRETVAALAARPHFAERGSLLLAHRGDAGTARRLLARLADAGPEARPNGEPAAASDIEVLDAAQLALLEPALQGAAQAWLLPGEGQIDAVAAMRALHDEAAGVRWNWRRPVRDARAGLLTFDDVSPQGFDLVIDVRGTGCRPELPVRGVRGEMVWLQARGHGLSRPVRLLHARHRVYIVPRPDDTLLVGASEIESEDRSPMSLKSAVELMSAAHSVMPALAEARILRLDVNLRPALPDHEPRLDVAPGLVRINGLFRHGWLLAPALVEDALHRCGLTRAATPQAVAA